MGLRFILILALAGWAASEAATPAKVRVLASFFPAYCLAAKVTEGVLDVENLTSGGGGLHDYQLTPAEVRKIASADVIVINGLGLESWMEQALARSSKASVRVVRLSDGLENELIPLSDRASGQFNPHLWLDPLLAARSVRNIALVLEQADPGNTQRYAENAAHYVNRLASLTETIATRLQAVTNTAFITYHNAFPYFARRFHLRIATVVEPIAEVTPSPKYLTDLFQTIRTTHAKALFTEPGENNRLARMIARDAHIQLAELDPLEFGRLDPNAYEHALLKNVEILTGTLR